MRRGPTGLGMLLGSALLGTALLGLGCRAAIGIEEVREDPRTGAVVGPAGTAGREGDPEQGGAAGDGGGGSGGSANAAVVAAGGEAGSSATLEQTADGGILSGPAAVRGRVIDFFRRPVPDVPVTIGPTTVLTDAEGVFSIADIEGPYTASLVLSMIRNNAPARYAYVYEGLTRLDPTLQVYSALVQRSTSSVTVTLQNVDFEDPNRQVIFAFSSPDGRFANTALDGPASILLGAPSWTGPSTTAGNAHALRVLRPDNFGGEPPLAYEAYQTFPLAVANGAEASATFDMQLSPLPAASLSGSVSGSTLAYRSNLVSVRFADGTLLPVLDDTAAAENFSYLVPTLPGTSLALAATDGVIAPFVLTHQENVSPGRSDVALVLPKPVTLNGPQEGAEVTPSTAYSWSGLAQTAQTFVWHLEFSRTFEGMYVVTSRTQIELPSFADGFAIPPGTEVYWSVETHGDAVDVDALTGPDGFLDEYSLVRDAAAGPSRGDGYFTESERRAFTMGSD
jgi:hypothetical protein